MLFTIQVKSGMLYMINFVNEVKQHSNINANNCISIYLLNLIFIKTLKKNYLKFLNYQFLHFLGH